MKILFAAILFAYFVTALSQTKKAQYNLNNYIYAGPDCKKIGQQLAEIKNEIRALKTGTSGGKGLPRAILNFWIPFYQYLSLIMAQKYCFDLFLSQ